MKKTSDAVAILKARYIDCDPEFKAMVDEELFNAEIAQRIYDLRAKAKLSQRELAKRVGTTASVISRLENSDYAGHSLPMLRRISAALDARVEVRIVPIKPQRERAGAALHLQSASA